MGRSSRALNVAWAALVISVVVGLSVFGLYRLNASSGPGRALDEKTAIVLAHYGANRPDYVISSSGGYDESRGVWHYEFMWYTGDWLIYDSAEDLTESTVSRIQAIRSEDMPDGSLGD